jgi:hypothetical protein
MEPQYMPTPQQIRKECEKIQAEWTEAEMLKRARSGSQYDKSRLAVSRPENETE